VKKTHDYIHHYRGYWSDGGKCRIRIYIEGGQAPLVICSQLPEKLVRAPSYHPSEPSLVLDTDDK